MKRFAIFLGSLLVLPAFAEVVPDWYGADAVIEYDDTATEEIAEEAVEEQTAAKPSRLVNNGRTSTANRSASARAVAAGSSGTTTRASNSNSKRVVAARTGGVARTRAVGERGAISRAAARPAGRVSGTRGTVARSATSGTGNSGNVVSRAAAVKYSATTPQYNRIQGSGTSLYNATDTGRVGIRSGAGTARSPVVRVASIGTTTEDVALSTTDMDALAELTDYCKAQYASCMDNYCNVLDSDQGRCICSSNLKNYANTEAALKAATEELQEVAQKIRYIGLSAREVEQLFSQTEAELTMQSKTDTSQLKTNLDKIKNMIVDVQSGNASSSSGLDFDVSGLLDFSITSSGFDFSSLFGTSNTSSVSNQRGEELYKTATARCKTNVLNSCTAQGVDASLITNSYDLGIDQACIAYERSLNDSNDEMVATVRNAKRVLQEARYMVARQKNEYDMRQCINQLDACMQDDFVCGSDYENCLDPTGMYIVKGDIVVGSKPGAAGGTAGLYATWDYSATSGNNTSSLNAWGTGGDLAGYITNTVVAGASHAASTNMSKYLQNKIGYISKESNKGEVSYGMCVSVLKKCQDYSYTGTGASTVYKEDNDVIKQYLNRVLVQIKARQDEVLADYAEQCSTDVASCLNKNSYPSAKPNDTTSGWSASKETVALAACDAAITTCMSVNDISTTANNAKKCWARSVQYSDYTPASGDECASWNATDDRH